MFRTLAGLVPTDVDLPARAQRLDVLRHMLNDTLYDVLDMPSTTSATAPASTCR